MAAKKKTSAKAKGRAATTVLEDDEIESTPKTKTVKTSDPDHRQVRLKDHHPKSGHVLRQYTYRGIKFQTGRGFYRVPLSVANYLKGVRNVSDDPHSPKAFDVYTLEEAKAVVDKEYRAKVNGGRLMPGDSPVLQPRETEREIRPGVDGRAPTREELEIADQRRRDSHEAPAERRMVAG